jgi:hypothetical protein
VIFDGIEPIIRLYFYDIFITAAANEAAQPGLCDVITKAASVAKISRNCDGLI